jgi:hypothetical protein
MERISRGSRPTSASAPRPDRFHLFRCSLDAAFPVRVRLSRFRGQIVRQLRRHEFRLNLGQDRFRVDVDSEAGPRLGGGIGGATGDLVASGGASRIGLVTPVPGSKKARRLALRPEGDARRRHALDSDVALDELLRVDEKGRLTELEEVALRSGRVSDSNPIDGDLAP